MELDPLLMDEIDSIEDTGSPVPSERRQSLDQTVNDVGIGKFHVLLVLICGWANASDSVEVLCISLVLASVQCDMDISSSAQLGVLTAVIFLGMMVGGYFWGSVGDMSGRRTVMILSLFVNGLFGLLSSIAPTFWLFVLLRFLSGVGVGGSIPVIWSYFSEFQPSRIRGRMLSIIASFWMVGQLLTAGLAWILLPEQRLQMAVGGVTVRPWRVFLALSTLTCLSASFLVYFLPESPRYLISKGRNAEALEILANIFQMNSGRPKLEFPVDSLGESELKPIFPRGRNRSIKFREKILEIFSQTRELFQKNLRSTTLVMVVINFTLSFGAYGLTLWMPELFTRARIAGHSGPICQHSGLNGSAKALNCSEPPDETVFRDTFLIALSSLPGNLVTIALLDRVGRKPIFFCGAAFSALSAFMVWFVSNQLQVLVMSCIFGAFSVICWNCLDAFGTELFPTHLRATSLGVCLAVARVGAILGNLTFGALIDVHCAIPILMVAAMMALAALASLKLDETKNKPLLQ